MSEDCLFYHDTVQCLRETTPTFIGSAIVRRSFRRKKRGFIRFPGGSEFEFTYNLEERYLWVRLTPNKEWVGCKMYWHQGRWQHWGITCPFCYGNADCLYFIKPTHVRCTSCIRVKSLRQQLTLREVQQLRASIRSGNYGPVAEAFRKGKRRAWNARLAMEFEGLMPSLYVPQMRRSANAQVKSMSTHWKKYYHYHWKKSRIQIPRQYNLEYVNDEVRYRWKDIDNNLNTCSRECESDTTDKYILSEDGVVVLNPACGLGSGLLPVQSFPRLNASRWVGSTVRDGVVKSKPTPLWSSTLTETLSALANTTTARKPGSLQTTSSQTGRSNGRSEIEN